MPDTVIDPQPITEDWLRAVGFKWHQLERQPTKHWVLWLGSCIGYDSDGKRKRFVDSEDLGIEVTPTCPTPASWDGSWHCWVRSDMAGLYHRFLHIRYLHFTYELILMIEGLTGQTWDPENNMYGSMKTPTSAAWSRAEAQRLDLQLSRDRKKWYPAEEDDTRGRPLPEHLNAAIESRKAK